MEVVQLNKEREALKISTRTIERVRQRFVEESLENALNPRPKKSFKLKKIDGEAEAHITSHWLAHKYLKVITVGHYDYWQSPW